MVKIVYNELLCRWFIVRGPHQTPIGGSYATEREAKQALKDKK